jgi:hypothetical protein
VQGSLRERRDSNPRPSARKPAAVLVWRFVRTGGLPMLRMMNKPMGEHA